MLTGLFCAMAGLFELASTGVGTPVPGPYTLFSVAAVVLGGVSLAGGRGGLFGPIVAVLILSLIRSDMTFLSLDTNLALVAQGCILIGVVMVGSLIQLPSEPSMSAAATTAPRPALDGVRRLFRDRPIVPLIGLLVILVIMSELIRPGIVNANWAGVIVQAAIPLAILAGCQTLTMLTGGIDLSVGAVASMVGFVVATFVHGQGLETGLAVALVAAVLVGLVNGVGVGVFRVHPLIMTLGMSLVVLGLANAWQILTLQTFTGVADVLRTLGSGRFLDVLPNSLIVFIPVAALILLGLRRTGYGRLLYAVGDNPTAARLAGVRSWQVLIVVYVISALLGRDRRAPRVRPDQRRERAAGRLPDPAVRGGRGHRRDIDPGRPGRVRRDDRRGADPDRSCPRCSRRSGIPRRSSRSSSARSSWPSPPRTPG